MAKQTFTTGQVLTADNMTSLQQTAMGGGAATAKTASYTLVAADAGTTIIMNSASATTITVNTSLFTAGDTVFIVNQGAGICTITAGTATVSAAGSLAMSQYETGQLYFLSASAAIFTEYIQTAAAGGKVLQVVQGTTSTSTTISTTTYTDTTLTATITPFANTSKVLVLVMQNWTNFANAASAYSAIKLLRGVTDVYVSPTNFGMGGTYGNTSTIVESRGMAVVNYLDSPATTSATTYKTQGRPENSTSGQNVIFQQGSNPSTIILLEIGA